MSQADTFDIRTCEAQAVEARAAMTDFYRRLSPEDLRAHYETVREACELASVAARALAGDPDGALLQLESVAVVRLQDLHCAVIELCAAHLRSQVLFSVGGAGSVH